MFKNVAVSGGTGFIGSMLVDSLAERGVGVKVMDIRALKNKNNVEYVKANITVPSQLKGMLSGFDCLLHLAALIPKFQIKTSFSNYLEVNVKGTLNLLNECIRSGTGTLIFASTWQVYGEPEYLPVDEKHPLFNPSEFLKGRDKSVLDNEHVYYAISKILAEKHILPLAELYGIKTYILRFSNVIGPNASQQGAVSKFIENVSKKEAPVIYGDGSQQRDYIFVDDVVRSYIVLMDKLPKSSTFNIGSGRGYSVAEVAQTIIDIYKKDFHKSGSMTPVFKKSGKQFSKYLDTSLAKKEIGFEPSMDLEESLRKTILWYEKCQKEKSTK
jgi:UDP-glucose 4-epimerase